MTGCLGKANTKGTHTYIPTSPTISQSPLDKGAATPPAQPSPGVSSTPSTPRAGPLFLQIAEPPDETEVSVSPMRVKGVTSPGAIVSVNGELAEVDKNGLFETSIALEDGANYIEVIATNNLGDEVTAIRTVIYTP
ncbi:MAG: hypothetical protein HY664_07700 [Chloroflexi bacterium]|nr:hypothetical protein [Chloroflexota bacterium]